MIIHRGNRDMIVLFWIVIAMYIPQVTIQPHLLVCDAKARAGILYGKDFFDHLCYWKRLCK